jgi:hypothetical protein
MKVKTNLTPNELSKVGTGLLELAKSQLTHEYVPENNAEKELLRKTKVAFSSFVESLQTHFSEVLTETTI